MRNKKIISDLDLRLRISRELKRMQQKEVSEKTGISKSSLSNYETGDSVPSMHNLIDLADLYGVTLDYLCGRDADEALITKGLTPPQIEAVHRITEELRAANRAERIDSES